MAPTQPPLPGETRAKTTSHTPGVPLVPQWSLIAAGILGALSLIFVTGFGFGQSWGASQWGPFSAWLSSGLTFAAVVVALRGAALARREAARSQRSRLIDPKSPDAENLDAISDLWGALSSMHSVFTSFTQYLAGLPAKFEPNSPRNDGELPDRPGESLVAEISRRFETFVSTWTATAEPHLFRTLALLHSSPLYAPVKQLNADIRNLLEDMLPEVFPPVFLGQRPDTGPVIAAWSDIIRRRQDHLDLAHQHLSLALDSVERALDQ